MTDTDRKRHARILREREGHELDGFIEKYARRGVDEWEECEALWSKYRQLLLTNPAKFSRTLEDLEKRSAAREKELRAERGRLTSLHKLEQKLGTFQERSGIDDDRPIVDYLDHPRYQHPNVAFRDLELHRDGFIIEGLQQKMEASAAPPPSDLFVNGLGYFDLQTTWKAIRRALEQEKERARSQIEERVAPFESAHLEYRIACAIRREEDFSYVLTWAEASDALPLPEKEFLPNEHEVEEEKEETKSGDRRNRTSETLTPVKTEYQPRPQTRRRVIIAHRIVQHSTVGRLRRIKTKHDLNQYLSDFLYWEGSSKKRIDQPIDAVFQAIGYAPGRGKGDIDDALDLLHERVTSFEKTIGSAAVKAIEQVVKNWIDSDTSSG